MRLPNGSRLSCGASAGRRKRPALRYRLAGAQTSASAEGRPRQLQALVRHHGSGMERSRQILRARNSLMSRCRGTVDVFRADRFTYTEWWAPSRNSSQPWASICRMRSRRFKRA